MLPKHASLLSKDGKIRKMLLKKKVKDDQRIKNSWGDIWDRERTKNFCRSTNRRVSILNLLHVLKSLSTLTGPAHQRYLLSAGGSIYRCVDILIPPVRDLSPTSVHAYKSRQSRIPSDGLSRERGRRWVGEAHGDARRSPLRREFYSLHANGRHLL